MSDFSDQLHLKTTQTADALQILSKAGAKGYVFQPTNGWVTFLAQERNKLSAYNEGLLLHFSRTSDFLGWGFTLYEGTELVSEYSIQDYFDGFIINKEQLNFDKLVSVLALDEATQEALNTLFSIDNPEEAEGGDFSFAQLLGLEHIEYLAFEVVDADIDNVLEEYEDLICYNPAS